jgi:biopolymer transport protein TolR
VAEIQETGGGRPKNFEPNLVPFIDLMSVLITFLLITAVWTQVSMIQIGSSIYGKKDPNNQERPPVPPKAEIPLKLDIKPEGYVLTVGSEQTFLPLIAGRFDDAGWQGLSE